MSDRLEDIKKRYSTDGQVEDDTVNDRLLDLGTWPITEDIGWLISEVERLRSDNEQLESERNEFRKLYGRYVDRFTNAVGDRNKLRNEIKELAQSFREGKIGEITDSFLVDEILAIVGDKDD